MYEDSSSLASDLDAIQGELCAELEPEGRLLAAVEDSGLADVAALLESALCGPDPQLLLSDVLAIAAGEETVSGGASSGFVVAMRSLGGLAARALRGGADLRAALALGKALAQHPAALVVLPDLLAALGQGGV